jgi:aspartyl-tRNA(Asn)/glutamyl-tRNA(Gln) amidotransferase subunit A
MAVGAAAYHSDRFRRRPEDYPPKISQLIRDGMTCPAADYDRALRHHSRFRADIDTTFPDGWGTFVTPATPGPAPRADTTGDPVFNSPWSYAGLPTVSLPLGWSDSGLPLGVQLVGRRGRDEQLLALAMRLQDATGFEPGPLPL